MKKREDMIWRGPGVLNPAKKKKDLKPLHPGSTIPGGFVSDKRISDLVTKGKVVSEKDYARSQAASGKLPEKNTAQLKELTDKVAELTAANKELTDGDENAANEELTKANGELTTANEELTKANSELTTANEELTKANGELTKKAKS